MKKRVLVLGGGFGGLSAVLRLDGLIRRNGLGDGVEVKLVDRNEYHTFTPLLYEVATVMDGMSDRSIRSLVSYPFAELLERTSAEYVKGEAESIDFKKRKVVLKNGDGIPFDYLILSPGSEAAFYGMEGIKKHGFSLKTLDDALEIRDELKKRMGGKKKLRVIVGGGGYTGVELAGEIRVMAERTEGGEIEVTIVEGNDSVLHGLDERVIRRAKRRLDEIGVEVEAGSLISGVKEDRVILKNGKELPFDVFLWSGGIKASSMSEKMEFEKKGSGKMMVGETLEARDGKEFENVYSVGDFSYFEDPETGKPEPAVARVAINGGRVAAENVVSKIMKKGEKKYECRDYPYVIPIGGKYAIAKFGPFVFSGFPAWIAKGLVELNYFISILSFPRALEVWFRGLRTFIKNDRLG